MTDLDRTRENPAGQLWDMLEEVHAVMLGSPDPSQHMQPMTPEVARDEKAIWFYTRKDSDIARAAATGGTCHLCVVSRDHDYHACLHGTLEAFHSPEHIDRFWSAAVGAWYEGGKDDPNLTMLRYVPSDAAIWASTGSTIRYGWELMKAAITDHEPDVGMTARVSF